MTSLLTSVARTLKDYPSPLSLRQNLFRQSLFPGKVYRLRLDTSSFRDLFPAEPTLPTSSIEEVLPLSEEVHSVSFLFPYLQ